MSGCQDCKTFKGPAWQPAVDKKRKVLDLLGKKPIKVNIDWKKVRIIHLGSEHFPSVMEAFIEDKSMIYAIDIENSITPWNKETGNIPVLVQLMRSYEKKRSPKNDDALLITIRLDATPAVFDGTGKPLKKFLESSSYDKYGFGIGSDIHTMKKQFGVSVKMHDLQKDFTPQIGLTTAVALYGVDVISPVLTEHTYPTFSKWQAHRLCQCQLTYAFYDVWSVMLLAKLKKSLPPKQRDFTKRIGDHHATLRKQPTVREERKQEPIDEPVEPDETVPSD